MFIAAVLTALASTIGLCLIALFIKWIIVQVGAAVFAALLIGFSLLFLLIGGNEDG